MSMQNNTEIKGQAKDNTEITLPKAPKVYSCLEEIENFENRKKVLFFYNPHSGNGLFKANIDTIIERFQDNGLQVIPVRAAKGLAIERALKSIDESEYRMIIAAGGDGTINICVNSMVRNDCHLPLALFPSGTANDFAGFFGISTVIDEMIDVALGSNFVYADVGVCNDRCFINVAALGSLVDVSQKTDPSLKNSLGVFAYYLKGASELITLKPIPIKLTTDKEVIEENMLFMLVMNGQSAGGFKNISPESEINDGLLDVIIFKEMPLIELPNVFVHVLHGDHMSHKKIISFRTDNLLIESDVHVPTDVDGEHGEQLPLKLSVLHNRLKVFTHRKLESEEAPEDAE